MNRISEWLINNKPTTLDIINNVLFRRINNITMFGEEANDQFYDEVQKELLNHLTKDLACTIEEYYDTIDKEVFINYVEEVMK